jgi:single-stranded-DNA-specific exonuclease
MAAGCTLAEGDFPRFAGLLVAVAEEQLDAAALQRRLPVDGPLPPQWFDAATVQELESQVWGQAFDAPLFCDEVQVVAQRLVGERHLKLRLKLHGVLRDAIWFNHVTPLPDTARLAYRVRLDVWQGQQRLQMEVQAQA